MSFVFLVSQVNMLYYAQNANLLTFIYNETLNKTIISRKNISSCNQANLQILLAQDMIFVIMRIILPFIIMVICNVILVNYISSKRKVIIRGRKEKREHSFTIVVSIINGSFLICNISVVIYYIIVYYYRFSGTTVLVETYITSLFGTCAILFSYLFTLSEFFIDVIFNKVFRIKMLSLLLYLTKFRFKFEIRINRPNIQESNL